MPDGTPAPSPDPEQDKELVARLVTGDNAAWQEFFDRFGARISSAIRRAGIDDGNREEAHSYVIEGLVMNDYLRLRSWDRNRSFPAYLYKVAKNLAIDFGRSQLPTTPDRSRHFVLEGDGQFTEAAETPNRSRRLVLDGDGQITEAVGARAAKTREPLPPEIQLQEAELHEAILRCLFRMPNGPDREMILFRYYLGLSAKEIASLSGRDRNAVDQALHRAHRNFKAVAAEVHPELIEYLPEER